MKLKAVSGVMLTLLLTSMLTLAFNIQPVRSEPTTIYVFEVVWCGEIFHVSVKSNSSVSDFYFDLPMKEMGFNVSGPDGTIGFCNVTIPNELRYGAIGLVITVDTEPVTDFATVNATHTLLYFTYTHSTHEVRIIWVWEIAPRTWTVDDDGPADFHTIQEAVNVARPGDTVLVSSGTYYEHVFINKSISLIGENPSSTIIDGNGTGAVVSIYSNFVTVKRFTIQNSGFPFAGLPSGIEMGGFSNCTITNNIITSNKGGIALLFGGKHTVTNNTISSNYYGMYIVYSVNNTIFHNYFLNNTNQAYITGATNTWDNGYPSGGNYWSDYEDKYPDAGEINESGLWDTPYVIDEKNQDNYPIVPEFPTWTSMLLILITLTFATIIYKRRLIKTPIY